MPPPYVSTHTNVNRLGLKRLLSPETIEVGGIVWQEVRKNLEETLQILEDLVSLKGRNLVPFLLCFHHLSKSFIDIQVVILLLLYASSILSALKFLLIHSLNNGKQSFWKRFE